MFSSRSLLKLACILQKYPLFLLGRNEFLIFTIQRRVLETFHSEKGMLNIKQSTVEIKIHFDKIAAIGHNNDLGINICINLTSRFSHKFSHLRKYSYFIHFKNEYQLKHMVETFYHIFV